MFRFAIPIVLTFAFAVPVAAQTPDPVVAALRLQDTVEILRAEGLNYGDTLASEMFNSAPTASWTDAVDLIFDANMMFDTFATEVTDALTRDDAAAITEFYTTDPGIHVARLELAARRGLLDDTVELAAIRDAGEAIRDGHPKMVRVQNMVADRDLIETETVSAMNLSLAFYRGLLDGGGLGETRTEADILRDIYDRRDAMRAEVTERLYAYLWLVVQSLTNDQIDTYIAFADSDAGIALDQAMTAGFDDIYFRASRQLGLAAAAEMRGEDL